MRRAVRSAARSALLVVTVSALAAITPRSACADDAAPDKETCVASFDRGQREQADHKLRRAQAALIVCAQESCPNVLRADCAGVLADVRRALPSLVFVADDGHGHELLNVRVSGGGETLTERLDGRAVTLDPGTLELTFESPGFARAVLPLVIREGEKNRIVRVSLGPGAVDASGADAAGRASGPSRSTAGWVVPVALSVAGAASLVVAGVSRASFDSRVDDLRATCAPACTPAQRDDLSSTLVTSNVALGVGLGLVALGIASWFVWSPASSRNGSGNGKTAPARAYGGPGRWVF